MSVTEVLQGLGEWSLTLAEDTPKEILDQLDLYGHIAIHAGVVDPRVARDALLLDSRYVGVYRGKSSNPTDEGTQYGLRGPGMAFWLGDEDGKGHAIESPLTLNTTFAAWVAALLPPSVIAGTIVAVPKNFNYTFQYVTPREALNYMCGTLECAWRINGNASVDAGLESDLFTVIPEAALVRKGQGADMFLKAMSGSMSTEIDMSDFTTRAVLLANGAEAATVTATADIAPVKNPYKDLFGNALKLTRFISESDTDATNASARAQLQLNRFSDAKRAISLSTNDYDLKGDVAVGDYMWVFDPDIGVVDITNELVFRGDRMYPMKLRLTEMTWPVTEEMGVAFRDQDGNWFDLTPYIVPEGGESSLVVGGFYRSLGDGDGGSVGSRPIADTSIPGVPVWDTPFVHSIYQSANGASRAQVQLKWTRPLNVDGSTILDGDHFEIRYRSSSTPVFPSTHVQMAAFTHIQLAGGTHEQPINYVPGPYDYASVPWDQLAFLLQDLPTNMPYEAEIRAVDSAKPANVGAWSAVTVFQTSGDTLPPATPAPPTIAAGRMNVQMKHELGRSDGGTYNLDADLNHFELHGEYEPLFTPSDTTLLGKVSANNGMILSHVPAVGSVPIESVLPVYFKVIAVDHDGNKSQASTAVQSTALLVDNAHISDLTVSKVTAGTITAEWLNAGRIWSGTDGGARAQVVPAGFEAYDATNTRTFFVEAATGNVTITGTFQSGTAGNRVILSPPADAYSTNRARIDWRSSSDTHHVTAVAFGDNFLIQRESTPVRTNSGGYLLFASSGSWWGYRDVTNDWSYGIGSTGNHTVVGHFQKTYTEGGKSALYVDQIGGSGTSQSVTYGATMATTPNPIVDIMPTSGGATGKYSCISARSATGFTVTYPSGNCDIFIWSFRAA
jgi:hypothetical protein